MNDIKIVEPEFIQYAMSLQNSESNAISDISLNLPISIEIQIPQAQPSQILQDIYSEVEFVETISVPIRYRYRYSNRRRNKYNYINITLCKSISIASISLMIASFIIHNII